MQIGRLRKCQSSEMNIIQILQLATTLRRRSNGGPGYAPKFHPNHLTPRPRPRMPPSPSKSSRRNRARQSGKEERGRRSSSPNTLPGIFSNGRKAASTGPRALCCCYSFCKKGTLLTKLFSMARWLCSSAWPGPVFGAAAVVKGLHSRRFECW